MAVAPAHTEELATRVSDGMYVSLLWDRGSNRTWVTVDDRKCGHSFTLGVTAHQNPMDVFEHPYAYAMAAGAGDDSSRTARGDTPGAPTLTPTPTPSSES